MAENDNEILNSLHKSINELLDVVKPDDKEEPVKAPEPEPKAPEPEPVKAPEPVIKEPTNNIVDNVKKTVSNMFQSEEQQPQQQYIREQAPQLSDFMNFNRPSIPSRSDFMNQLSKDYSTYTTKDIDKKVLHRSLFQQG